MATRILALCVLLMFVSGGCSREGTEASPHALQGEVKALDKAKSLEDDMNEAFKKRAGEVDRQAR